ncbi:ATP-binding protein [Desulfovibrio aminophilus]|uniref:ATP-binding protein n=1 Tax=Desulfovibrio aminophilus TaxID=81425 RepID=UPI0033946D87
MHALDRLKFSSKINLGTTGIVLFLSLVMGAPVARVASQALVDEVKMRGRVLAESLSVRSADPVLAQDFLRLKNLVDDLRGVSGDIEYAFILDKAGGVLAHSYPKGFPVDLITANAPGPGGGLSVRLLDSGDERIYDFAVPVRVAGESFGTARVGLSWTRARAPVERLGGIILGLAGGGLFVSVVLSTIFARQVTRRLNILRTHAAEMVTGNLDMQAGGELARNCWDIMDCDRKECPAYGDKRRRCWYVAGTLCLECDGGPFPQKLESCRECPVYLANAGDEIQDLTETFDAMAMTLKTHIAELREAEKVLTRQQQIMRTILDVTPDLVSLLDEHLVYQACNRAFAASVSREVDEVAGKTDADLFPAELAAARTEANRRVLLTGERFQTETRREAGHGERWFHTVQVPVFDRDDRIVGVLRTARDVTQIKDYQDQLIQAQKMESLGKLAGGVAHEINTPLGIILGYAQLLQEDVPEGQLREDLGIIERQAKVCRKIVADLLGFSRQSRSARRDMCLNNSVMETVTLVRHSFELDKVRIVTDLDERMPVLYGDPDKLRQVWMNLLTNARDAMPTGGLVFVRTRLDTGAQKVTVWVADTGSGIEPADLGRIFDPFFSTKPVGKGTGLGLAVSFGIVKEHGGDISAQSPVPADFGLPRGEAAGEHGAGSVFAVHLPLDHGERDDEDTPPPGDGAKEE